jgi:hypothetical protein
MLGWMIWLARACGFVAQITALENLRSHVSLIIINVCRSTFEILLILQLRHTVYFNDGFMILG